MTMSEIIEDNKYVELTYKVVDKKTGNILTLVEFPLGYVHGATEVLLPAITNELAGKCQGDSIEVPIDCNELFGPRDESLVITDYLQNVPKEYHEVGTKIVMESEKGETKTFFVTRLDDKTLTIDGNHPLSGRDVIFRLEIQTVRDATDEEIEAGGKTESGPDFDATLQKLH